MESMAALTNLPNREVKSHPDGKPSKETFDVIFQEYQERQIPRTQKVTEFANLITRVQAWDGLWMKLMALWVVPVQSGKKLGQDPGDIINGGIGWISCQFESIKRRMSCGMISSSQGKRPLGIRYRISQKNNRYHYWECL